MMTDKEKFNGSLNGYRFLWIGIRARINAAALNNKETVGNQSYLQKMVVVVKKDNGEYDIVTDVPVISGNMVRHWVWEGFVETHDKNDLSPIAKKHAAVRFTKDHKPESPEKAVKEWGDADIFGFLIAEGEASEKRTSPLWVSFALPIEEVVERFATEMTTTATHNRVAQVSGSDTDMMVFHKEYASAPYAFTLFLNIWKVGKEEFGDNYLIDGATARERVKSLIEGLSYLLSGAAGAGMARAFPAFKVDEAIAVLSDRPMPLVHPFYKDWKSSIPADSQSSPKVKVVPLKNGDVKAFLNEIKKELGL